VNDHLTGLADRRAQLQLKAAAHRQQLGELVDSIEARTQGIDQVLLKARPFVRKPVLFAGAAAILLFVGPGRALRLLGKGMLMFSAARRLLGF
jgi:YqjK-like protein